MKVTHERLFFGCCRLIVSECFVFCLNRMVFSDFESLMRLYTAITNIFRALDTPRGGRFIFSATATFDHSFCVRIADIGQCVVGTRFGRFDEELIQDYFIRLTGHIAVRTMHHCRLAAIDFFEFRRYTIVTAHMQTFK